MATIKTTIDERTMTGERVTVTITDTNFRELMIWSNTPIHLLTRNMDEKNQELTMVFINDLTGKWYITVDSTVDGDNFSHLISHSNLVNGNVVETTRINWTKISKEETQVMLSSKMSHYTIFMDGVFVNEEDDH